MSAATAKVSVEPAAERIDEAEVEPAVLAAAAAQVQPVANEDGTRCRVYVGVDDELRYSAYYAPDMGRKRGPFVGPSFANPRPACAFATLLNATLYQRPNGVLWPPVSGHAAYLDSPAGADSIA